MSTQMNPSKKPGKDRMIVWNLFEEISHLIRGFGKGIERFTC